MSWQLHIVINDHTPTYFRNHKINNARQLSLNYPKLSVHILLVKSNS